MPYTVIARLENAEVEEGNAWEGKIGALKTFIGRKLKQQDEVTKKLINQIEDKQEKFRLEEEK